MYRRRRERGKEGSHRNSVNVGSLSATRRRYFFHFDSFPVAMLISRSSFARLGLLPLWAQVRPSLSTKRATEEEKEQVKLLSCAGNVPSPLRTSSAVFTQSKTVNTTPQDCPSSSLRRAKEKWKEERDEKSFGSFFLSLSAASHRRPLSFPPSPQHAHAAKLT